MKEAHRVHKELSVCSQMQVECQIDHWISLLYFLGPPGEQGIQGLRGLSGEVGPQGERGEVKSKSSLRMIFIKLHSHTTFAKRSQTLRMSDFIVVTSL